MGGKRVAGKPCHWCRRKMHSQGSGGSLAATRDHVIPQVAGGYRTGKNVVWACAACNNVKAAMLPGEWHAFMCENPEWWKLYAARARRQRAEAHRLRNGVPRAAARPA